MSTTELILLALGLPLLGTVTNLLMARCPNPRDIATFAVAVALFCTVLLITVGFANGQTYSLDVFTFAPGLSIAFQIEPLGLVFALVASGLWTVTHLYGVGYMRGNGEKNHARFFASFSFSLFATMGIAFAGNLLTLFLFYELLTVGTYPLVAHKQNADAKAGARTYLGILMGTSIVFLLTAIVWTWTITGTLDFRPGGILAGEANSTMLVVLLALFAFGIGKAALMPFHRWLPAAMVAPTPVSALLHAVAVVKAGVFSMLKVGTYTFGIDTLSRTGTSEWLMWVAAFSLLAASIVAIRQDNLKRRLAYSTVSQLSYITLGMALATSLGTLGGALHIVTHAFGKITLFMCAGAIYVATHRTEIPQLRGLGFAMPFTFAAFAVGAASIIGLPPFAGAWSKWQLMLGAADAGQTVMIGVLIVSSLLNVLYLLPIFVRGFYGATEGPRPAFAEAPFLCVLPPCLTALGCFVLFFYADGIMEFVRPIVLGGSP